MADPTQTLMQALQGRQTPFDVLNNPPSDDPRQNAVDYAQELGRTTAAQSALFPIQRYQDGSYGLGVPGMIQDAWDAIKLPGDAYAGKVDLNSPEGFSRVMGLTGLMAGSGLMAAPEEGALNMGFRRPFASGEGRANIGHNGGPPINPPVEPTQEQIDAIVARAREMKRAAWPTAQNPIFDTSPEAYARSSGYVPQQSIADRLPAPLPGEALPNGGRAQQIIDATPQIAASIANRLRPMFEGSDPMGHFYSTGPIIEGLMQHAGMSQDEAVQFMRDWAGQGAATSPRTATPTNLRNASYLQYQAGQGTPFDRAAFDANGNTPGYPMMGMHVDLADQFRTGTENPWTNPKPYTFRENWSGNQSDITADTHNIRATLYHYDQLNPGGLHPDWFRNEDAYNRYRANGGFTPDAPMNVGDIADTLGSVTRGGQKRQSEYSIMTEPWRQAADQLGIQPAMAQSAGWFNHGAITGLRSPNKTIPDLLNDQLEDTARAAGVSTPQILKWWAQKKIPLAENEQQPNLALPLSGIG